MHKGNELLQQSINYWIAGWPGYVSFIECDSRPILSIVEKLSRYFRADINDYKHRERIMIAIRNISAYCSRDKDWREANLYSIDQALQTIMQKMIADKRTSDEDKREAALAQRLCEASKAQRERMDREMDETRLKLKEEYEKNWTEENEREYEAYMKRIQPAKVISMDPCKDSSLNKAL